MTGQERVVEFPKVLLLGISLQGGGAENHLQLMAKVLLEGGISLALFKTDGLEKLSGHQSPLHLGWAGARSYPTMITRLRRHLKQHDFDAVFAFGFYPIAIAWAAAKGLHRRPALIFMEITCPLKANRDMSSSLRRIATDAVRTVVYPDADLFAANSEDGLSEVIRGYGVAAERARRLPNLVDSDRLEQLAAEGEPAQAIDGIASICVAARLERLKRVDTLLTAAAGLPWELPWRIDVLGDGNQRAELEALSRTLGIADRVYFRGWMNNPYPIMSRATVSVLCSEYEGFSNSVIEAMALRTPVITSLCTTDARNMCERGAALGFPVGDHMGLRTELMRVLGDETLRARLKTKAWAYIQRHMIYYAIAEYEQLIINAIARHRSGY